MADDRKKSFGRMIREDRKPVVWTGKEGAFEALLKALREKRRLK